GYHSSLAFSADGRPAVSYTFFDGANVTLRYAVRNGTAWQASTVDSTGSVGLGSSLKFSPGGQPGVSYLNSTGLLKFATRAPFTNP
ncbi:hypothetical protein HQ447_04675, partial [bacterium]|nr:hypothetical protein [bacterium]